jgi:hypothetical protein
MYVYILCNTFRIYLRNVAFNADRDSVVVIATSYGLDGPGVESRYTARFSASVQIGHDDQLVPVVKRAGSGADHPPLSSAEVKERVELYLYDISGTSRPVPGCRLPLMLN